MHHTITGVDLAKEEIQVCVTKHNKVHSNKAMTPIEFSAWLASNKKMIVVFEACGTSNYWKQRTLEYGHDARLISAKLVSSVRQNQKTDKNDALAIAQAAQLTDVSFINGKSKEQQELQTLARLRELAVKHKVALQNQLTALLLEFNIRVSSAKGGLSGVIESVLEDADNGFSMPFRDALYTGWQQYLFNLKNIQKYDLCIEKAANKNVRSSLVSGAMAAINQATRRKAKAKKDLWIQQLVERRGKRCAAVALANKTVRTAFAMLTNNTEYKAELLTA